MGRLKNGTVTIGIAGTDHGVGVTHFAIMLASYLASKERKKIALLEENKTETFVHLRETYGLEESVEKSFRLNEVDYYYQLSAREKKQLVEVGYDYLLYDFGIWTKEKQQMFVSCGGVVILSAFNEWNIQKVCQWYEENQMFYWQQSVVLLAGFGHRKLKKNFEKTRHVQLYQIPYEETPFLLHRKNLSFFGQVMGAVQI